MEFRELTAALETALHLDRSFDLQKRPFRAVDGSREAVFYSLAGAVDSEMAEKILSFAVACHRAEDCIFNIPHPDVSQSEEVMTLVDAILTGRGVLAVEGVPKAAVIDCKSYSLRAVSEPENDRVLRGPRDGFGESLVRNTSLIRRRLRDPALIIERLTVGDPARVSKSQKSSLSSDCSLQLDYMKLESLVIANQNVAVNTFPGLVHTARHTMGVRNARSQ